MQIHSAARRGDIDGIRYCLQRGVPIDQKDWEQTPLTEALWAIDRKRRGPTANFETIRFLLEAGANPNATGPMEQSPLELAIYEGSLALVQLLCRYGADASLQTPRRDGILSDLFLLRRGNWQEILTYLIERGLRLVALDGRPNLYLEETLDGGHFAALKAAFEEQNESRPRGWNAVHEMLVRGSAAELKTTVIEAGDLKQPVGRYHYTPFLLAVAMGDAEKANLLLERGASLHETGWYGRSALHVAIEKGQPAMIPWLVGKGLPVDVLDEGNGTPLMHACQLDLPDCVALLLQHGASACYKGEACRPIHMARSLEVTRLLVECGGAEINEVDECGEWPLQNAAFSGDYEWVKWLLDHEAEVDLTSTGETALFKAVFVDALEVARLLLEHGANPNVTDVDGGNPFHNVRSREMVELLRSFGGDPSIYHGPSRPPKQSIGDPLIQELL